VCSSDLPQAHALVLAGWDKSVRLWDVVAGKELRAFDGKRNQRPAFAVAPDGKFLAVVSGSKSVQIFDVATGREVRVIESPESVGSVAYAPDGKTLATAGKLLQLWDTASGKAIRTADGPGTVWIGFMPDGKGLLTYDVDQQLILWDERRKRERRKRTQLVLNGNELRPLSSSSFFLT
jgi:WD40 repeat protein